MTEQQGQALAAIVIGALLLAAALQVGAAAVGMLSASPGRRGLAFTAGLAVGLVVTAAFGWYCLSGLSRPALALGSPVLGMASAYVTARAVGARKGR
jgi:hypothetical protein